MVLPTAKGISSEHVWPPLYFNINSPLPALWLKSQNQDDISQISNRLKRTFGYLLWMLTSTYFNVPLPVFVSKVKIRGIFSLTSNRPDRTFGFGFHTATCLLKISVLGYMVRKSRSITFQQCIEIFDRSDEET